jgi:aryl carrier-like protein
VRQVGHADNFFVLGGDSMRAMKVMAEVNALCKAEHPVSLLYENPTLHGLAGVLAPRGARPACEESDEMAQCLSPLAE